MTIKAEYPICQLKIAGLNCPCFSFNKHIISHRGGWSKGRALKRLGENFL